MNQGLYIDALRGMDGTGLATVTANGHVTIIKKALAATDFLDLSGVDTELDSNLNRVYIGHNRAATRGGISNKSSHPFQHDHITMVHNGSLKTVADLINYRDFDVDSDNIAYSLAKEGVDETLLKLNGAFALVWYDSDTKLVNMVRNSERPLSFATLKNNNGIVYASESDMLEYVAGRTGVLLEDIYDVPEEYLLSFDPNSKKISNFDERKVKFKPAYSYNSNNYHKGNNVKKKENKDTTLKKEEGNKERELLIDSRLKEIGITNGERIDITMYTFTPFKNTKKKRGTWEGCTLGDVYSSVVCYGASKKLFDVGDNYTGIVIGVTCDAPEGVKPNPYTDYKIIVSNDSIKGEGEEAEAVILLKDDKGVKGDAPFRESPILLPPFKGEKDDKPNVEFLYLRGPHNIDIPRKSWEALVANGCSYCGGNIFPHEAEFVEWDGEYGDDPLCPDCAHTPMHKRFPVH